MIINNLIEIVVNSMDVKRLSEINDKYKNIRKGDILIINVSDLSKKSGRKIEVKCDICGKEKKLSYDKYLKNFNNCNFYSCSSKCSQDKVKKTCMINFGATNASLSDEKKKKRIRTFEKKYGTSNPFGNKEIQKKLKQISINKYGVDNVFKSEEFKKFIKDYNLEKYGVEYISQVEELYIKQQKSGYRLHYHENTKLRYRGTYEKHFLDFCFNNKITIEQGKRIKYNYNGTDHYYFSDYYIKSKNLIVEIKSSWTYNKYLIKNIIKRNATIEEGYNYMFIIDKNYDDFLLLYNS